MKSFSVTNIQDTDENPFDRQERITWWRQDKISSAKIMVAGAGAIGNETLKNLALLGIRNLFIADFDIISTSNLSRAVLFRTIDEGKKKAEIAALRTSELCLASDINIDWFDGDIVWDLGTGLFREMDIVLGCLDNVETRFAINSKCWLAKTPWIDAGINELAGHVSVFSSSEAPCYECAASKEQLQAKRRRYSCDDFKISMLSEGKMPTVQISSAIISAIQVQEAIKLLCNKKAAVGKQVYFQGTINDFDLLSLPSNPHCLAHASYPEVISLPLSSEIKLKDFLEYVSQPEFSNSGATLDFRADRTFVISSSCRSCGKSIEFYKPSFRIYDIETICLDCREKGNSVDDIDFKQEASKVTVGQFNLENTEERILNMTMREIGVPLFHIVAVTDENEKYKYYEIAGDKRLVIPNLSK